jgi:hypothetical protein
MRFSNIPATSSCTDYMGLIAGLESNMSANILSFTNTMGISSSTEYSERDKVESSSTLAGNPADESGRKEIFYRKFFDISMSAMKYDTELTRREMRALKTIKEELETLGEDLASLEFNITIGEGLNESDMTEENFEHFAMVFAKLKEAVRKENEDLAELGLLL